jgi:hypothetical protein
MGAVPPQPSGRKGVTDDLFVVRRRRCEGIDSSSLLDLVSQDPSASANLSLGQDTSVLSQNSESKLKGQGSLVPASRTLL